jgi:hypothetical protein
MSKRVYPKMLAEERMYALRVAELQASWRGRADIDPGQRAFGAMSPWIAEGPLLAAALHDAREAGIDLKGDADDEAFLFMNRRRLHYHKTLRWVAYGMPVYRIDRDTTHALASTGVGGVEFDDLRMPFPTMLVYFDGPERYLYLKIRGEMAAVRVMWIHASEDGPGGSRCIHVHMFTRTDRDGLEATLPSGTDLDRFMADYATAQGREHLAFATSFLLYLACVPPRPCKTRVPGVDRARRNDWELPSEWQVVPAKIESGSCGTRGESQPHASPRAHVVRGHWRMQACGHGRAQRKPMWIKPHWRGEFCPGITRDMEK